MMCRALVCVVALAALSPATTSAAAVAGTGSSCGAAGSIPAGAPWSTCVLSASPAYGPVPSTGVSFTTSDAPLQALFSHAEACAAGNVRTFAPGFDVLVEGAGYGNVWLETQPMGGAMFGVRNLTLALANALVFARTQRADGRLPGLVRDISGNGTVQAQFSYFPDAAKSLLQGFYFASPAVDVAVLAAAGAPAFPAAAYLSELARALESFDAWLWAERNSTRSGVPWLNGTEDTGEDGSDK